MLSTRFQAIRLITVVLGTAAVSLALSFSDGAEPAATDEKRLEDMVGRPRERRHSGDAGPGSISLTDQTKPWPSSKSN